MNRILILVSLFLFSSGYSQINFNGVWQGILVRDGSTLEKGTIFFANINSEDGNVEGSTREEIYDSEYLAVKKIKGSSDSSTINFKQYVTEKKSSSARITWCNYDITLTYNDSSGYLEGRFKSTDCRRVSGKIILYRSHDVPFSTSETPLLIHHWMDVYIKEIKKGMNAPEIRAIERSNFVFKPIYFDYDKSDIKPDFVTFLLKLIRVVDGHSDLRVRVTGNTDSDGSDEYNVELSKRRADAIIDFFVAKGLSKDRLEIDFKGEKNPVDSNKTSDGKQRNRRVDFEFI
jgi:OOP family OmpA-OmpF porin